MPQNKLQCTHKYKKDESSLPAAATALVHMYFVLCATTMVGYKRSKINITNYEKGPNQFLISVAVSHF